MALQFWLNSPNLSLMDEAAKQQEIERLLQLRRIKVIEQPTATAFVCVYSCEDVKDGFHTFCFLQPQQHAKSFLEDTGWDHRPDSFTPHVECVEHRRTSEKVREVYYLRDGNRGDAQALVRERYYWGLRPPALEIAEEFRLFHNLYHDTIRNVFFHCDVHGVEHEVIRILNSHVEVHLQFLTDFLRAKQMHLAMQWEGNYGCMRSLEELDLQPMRKEQLGEQFRWDITVSQGMLSNECKCISTLLGKALILCPGPVEYHNPFEEDAADSPSFIVGHDDHGAPVTKSCDRNTVKDDPGSGLLPVFFRRSVLRKYFDEPAKFSVEGGYLRCGGLWGLKMDNDHPKYVIVFLKELGLGLPPAERRHWFNYNVLPDGGVSKTFFNSQVIGKFSREGPSMPDLKLKCLYPRANMLWQKTHGWPLWCEPTEEDRYVFHQAHVCLDESQTEFDQQNGLLAKLLNEFLNEEKIQAALRTQPADPGKLNLLQQFLVEAGYADAKKRLKPLRAIQELRSTGMAHPKGNKYKEAMKRAGLDTFSLVQASMKAFADAAEFIEWLKVDVLKDKS